jgi:uncharacterized protein YdhG (YjbR/CyaY superfamily)
MGSRSRTIDEYLEGLTPERRAALSQLRNLIFEVVPDAVEDFQYRMPTYWVEGESLCAMASQKHYMSLYMKVDLVEKHRGELVELDCGKSCIRFRKLEKLPLDTVRSILHETAQGIRGA